MSNIIHIHQAQNPDNVLEEAKEKFDSVLIIGWGKDGLLDSFASTNLKLSDVNWLLDAFKHRLIRGDYSSD